jgi:hypothetical protein
MTAMQTHDQRDGLESPAIVAAILAVAAAALADESTLGIDVAFGTRPGNVIGTGNSLPTSDRASNIKEANTPSRIAPRLQSPQAVSDSPQELLRAASRALEAGRTGEAQEALERAETRLLSRSVPPARIGHASADPLVSPIAEGRGSLAENRGQAARLIEATLRPGFSHVGG